MTIVLILSGSGLFMGGVIAGVMVYKVYLHVLYDVQRKIRQIERGR